MLLSTHSPFFSHLKYSSSSSVRYTRSPCAASSVFTMRVASLEPLQPRATTIRGCSALALLSAAANGANCASSLPLETDRGVSM